MGLALSQSAPPRQSLRCGLVQVWTTWPSGGETRARKAMEDSFRSQRPRPCPGALVADGAGCALMVLGGALRQGPHHYPWPLPSAPACGLRAPGQPAGSSLCHQPPAYLCSALPPGHTGKKLHEVQRILPGYLTVEDATQLERSEPGMSEMATPLVFWQKQGAVPAGWWGCSRLRSQRAILSSCPSDFARIARRWGGKVRLVTSHSKFR